MRNANRRRRLLLLSPTEEGEGDVLSLEETEQTVAPPSRAVRKFADACGATGPIRLQVTGPDLSEPQEYSFDTPYVVIGHSRKASLRLDHPDVSLRHSYLQMIEGRLYCVDLHSRTGTTGNGDCGGGKVVSVGETIKIGPYQVKLLTGDDWNQFDDPEAHDSGILLNHAADEFARVTAEVVNGDKRKRFRAIENTITLVGNAPECKLRLRDKSISKTHCALVRTPSGLWCVDLLGRNGTRINSSDVRFGQLKDGDLLKIGRAKIRMHDSHLDNDQLDEHEPDDSRIGQEYQADESQESTPVSPSLDSPQQSTDSEAATSDKPVMGSTMPEMTLGNIPMPTMPVPQMPMPTPAVQLPQTTGDSTPAERQVSEAFVMTLVNQFGEMQKQMYQQSQQSMMMLVNMFSTLHQNHMDLIRDDLNRIYEITNELQAVQAQIISGESATNVSYTREQQPTSEEDGVQDAEISEPVAAAPGQTDSQKPHGPETPPANDWKERAEAEGHKPRDRSGVRTHAWLNEQLATLESERASRWSKIMDTIKGMGGV